MTNQAEKEIKAIMHSLKCLCVREQIPMISIIQYKQNRNLKTYAEIVTPALVNFDTESRTIYDCANILNGQFTTIPAHDREEIDL